MYKSLLSILENEKATVEKVNALIGVRDYHIAELTKITDDCDDYEMQRRKCHCEGFEAVNAEIETQLEELEKIRSEIRDYLAELFNNRWLRFEMKF